LLGFSYNETMGTGKRPSAIISRHFHEDPGFNVYNGDAGELGDNVNEISGIQSSPSYGVRDESENRWLVKWAETWSGKPDCEYNSYALDTWLGTHRTPETIAVTRDFLRHEHLPCSLKKVKEKGVKFLEIEKLPVKPSPTPVLIKWDSSGTIAVECVKSGRKMKKNRDWHRKEHLLMEYADFIKLEWDRTDDNYAIRTSDEKYIWMDNGMSFSKVLSSLSPDDYQKGVVDEMEKKTRELAEYIDDQEVKRVLLKVANATDEKLEDLCSQLIGTKSFKKRYLEHLKVCREIARQALAVEKEAV
jgi:hypothetical protein